MQLSIVGDRDEAQHGPGALGQLLPGDDVGVMLHLASAGSSSPRRQVGVAPTAGDKIDALGRAVSEDHFFATRGVDERPDRFAGLLRNRSVL